MQISCRSWKKRMAFLCFVLIFAYASMLFFSHVTECFDTDCAVCTVIETSRRMMIVWTFFAVIYLTVKILSFIFANHSHILSCRDSTPVGLKVKLSD